MPVHRPSVCALWGDLYFVRDRRYVPHFLRRYGIYATRVLDFKSSEAFSGKL